MFHVKGNNLLDEQLAVSGLNMALDPATATLIATGVSTVASGIFGSQQANDQNRKAEKAAELKYEYDKLVWKQGKQRTKRDYKYLVEKVLTEEANFDTMRAYKDQTALNNFKYGLAIQGYELALQNRLFEKSEDLYVKNIDSAVAERNGAKDSVVEELKDTYRAAAFDNEDSILKSNRMLPPVPKPIPPVPLATPDMEFMLPPELQEFDFGPKPIKGVASYTSPGLSFANSVVSALPALAGGIASMSQGTLGGGGTTYGSGAQAPITGGTDYSGAFSGGNYSPMNPFG